MNKVKRYVPELVYQKLQTLNYKNIDHLYVICDMINRSSIYRKEDTDYSNKYIDIPQSYFCDIISDKNSYRTAMDTLIDNGIIECDGLYSKSGGKALGYRFSDEYISLLTYIYIDKITVAKKIGKNKNDRNNSVSNLLKPYKDNFIKTFKIDYDKSIKYLNNWLKSTPISTPPSLNSLLCSRKMSSHTDTNGFERSKNENMMKEWIKLINQYNSIFISLSAINDGDLFFRKNKTNGRIDTNLTSLKSEYKQFIINDNDLHQIDIVNSQPYMLSLLIDKKIDRSNLTIGEINEIDMYLDWTRRGVYYENFFKTYYSKTGKTLSRKEIKNIMFCIFYSKNESYTQQKKIFKSLFPTVLSFIEKQKSVKHNEFAIEMQKLESEICLDKICLELDIKNIKYYTIHDAWLVDKNDIDIVTNIINREFNDMYNSTPSLKIESIKGSVKEESLFI